MDVTDFASPSIGCILLKLEACCCLLQMIRRTSKTGVCACSVACLISQPQQQLSKSSVLAWQILAGSWDPGARCSLAKPAAAFSHGAYFTVAFTDFMAILAALAGVVLAALRLLLQLCPWRYGYTFHEKNRSSTSKNYSTTLPCPSPMLKRRGSLLGLSFCGHREHSKSVASDSPICKPVKNSRSPEPGDSRQADDSAATVSASHRMLF